jgi:hypothetical protein
MTNEQVKITASNIAFMQKNQHEDVTGLKRKTLLVEVAAQNCLNEVMLYVKLYTKKKYN